MEDQSATLDWHDGVLPISTRFDDPYYSRENGLAETRHVFLAGNDLPARFGPGFRIAELGFGTGLNFLAAWAAWNESGQEGALTFTSFEAFPMAREDIARAMGAFPEIEAMAGRFLDLWDGTLDVPCALESAVLTIRSGDARRSLPAWDGGADAWFLDGFSPSKNSELWEAGLMAEVARHTCPGGTAATYTAAGFVRRGLEAAGFEVTRVPGYGRKRHMARARLG